MRSIATAVIVKQLTTATVAALQLTKQHALTPLWVPTMIFYYPLATLAAYKAAWEMLVQPFYWDKTTHGEFDQAG